MNAYSAERHPFFFPWPRCLRQRKTTNSKSLFRSSQLINRPFSSTLGARGFGLCYLEYLILLLLTTTSLTAAIQKELPLLRAVMRCFTNLADKSQACDRLDQVHDHCRRTRPGQSSTHVSRMIFSNVSSVDKTLFHKCSLSRNSKSLAVQGFIVSSDGYIVTITT